nr:hypothetical protein [Tanacetum cinerariifolium]
YDPLALVESFTPIEDNIGLLETRFDEEAVVVFMFLEDVTGSVNLTLLSLFFGVTTTNLSLELLMLRQPIPFDERHFGLQPTKVEVLKELPNASMDIVLLVQAQVNGQILHEEELAFLADLGIAEVALMANLSRSGLDVLAEVHNSNNKDNNMINQAVVTSRYPTTNNQLRNSSKPRQQATINDGRVTLQLLHGRQISFATSTTRTYTPGASGSNSGKQMTVICYNYKGEGHMSKQCTKPKRKWDDSWFKDIVLLVQAQVNGQILHEEELAFLADL